MKKFLVLWEQDFKSTYWMVTGISLLMMILQIFLIKVASSSQSQKGYMPVEIIIQKAGCDKLFIAGLFLMIGCLVMNYFFNFYRSKSIYTMLSLPLSEKWLYLSKILTGVVYFLIFICGQLLAIIIASYLFKKPISYGLAVASYDGGETLTVSGKPLFAQHDIYMAFIRNKFLRVVLPLRWDLLILNVFLIMSGVIIIYYVFLGARSDKKVRCFTSAGISLMAIFLIVIQRVNEPRNYSIVIYVVILFVGMLFCIIDSLNLIRERAYF